MTPMRIFSRFIRLALCGAAFCVGAASASTPAVDAEVAVKAAVMHKIAKFVVWPESAFDSGNSPIVFCVAGDNRMYSALSSLDGSPVHGRTVIVRRIAEPAEAAQACQVLYLTTDDPDRTQIWLQEIADRPVLTFADAESHCGEYCIVTMTIRRNKVRFAINLDANENTGLSISAQLLQLAATVARGGP
jgi:hypothetical protein